MPSEDEQPHWADEAGTGMTDASSTAIMAELGKTKPMLRQLQHG